MSMSVPKTLAFMAVQRQIAASRSTRPPMNLQHGVFGGVPIVGPIDRPSMSAQTPNLRASLGQALLAADDDLPWRSLS